MTRRFRLLRVLTLVVAGASLAGCVAYPAGSYGYGHGGYGHGGYRSYAYSAPAYGGRGYGGGYGHGLAQQCGAEPAPAVVRVHGDVGHGQVLVVEIGQHEHDVADHPVVAADDPAQDTPVVPAPPQPASGLDQLGRRVLRAVDRLGRESPGTPAS